MKPRMTDEEIYVQFNYWFLFMGFTSEVKATLAIFQSQPKTVAACLASVELLFEFFDYHPSMC